MHLFEHWAWFNQYDDSSIIWQASEDNSARQQRAYKELFIIREATDTIRLSVICCKDRDFWKSLSQTTVQRLNRHQITQAAHQLFNATRFTMMKDVSFKVKRCTSALQAWIQTFSISLNQRFRSARHERLLFASSQSIISCQSSIF